jgi:hypothetical protein
MNTPANSENEASAPLQMATRKAVPSKLDPFTDQLLQMDQDKMTINKMLAWLHGQKMKCSQNTLRHFLTTRRAARNRNHLLEWLAAGSTQSRVVKKYFAKNAAPELETLIKLFRVLITQLSIRGAEDSELLKLANQLTHTALSFELGRTKSSLAERNLVMAEAKHAVWVKCEQTRALELCLKEAKKHPLVLRAFRNAFNALRDIQPPALRKVETPPSPAWRNSGTKKLSENGSPVASA